MAAVDTLVTVTQHGFVVREGLKDFPSPSQTTPSDNNTYDTQQPSSSPFHIPNEEAANANNVESGLSRRTLGLDTPVRSTAPAPLSSGLPCAGELRPAEHAHLSSGVKRLMRSVMRGLKAHQEPEAATEGLGGTYFFRNEAGHKIAIMKPCDEEPLAPNNPKGFVGRKLGEPGLKPTVRVGEAAAREVAAYLLDQDHFARVPHTVMAVMSHPIFHRAAASTTDNDSSMDADGGVVVGSVDAGKQGSLQEFVPHDCDSSELGAARFAVKDVQRIGILDIRLFNTDRHAGNILVRRARPTAVASFSRMDTTSALADLYLQEHKYELIPIDHGFALPEALEPPYFEWQHWPQAMMPFGKDELEYIAKLNAAEDAEFLRHELPTLREESLRLLQVSTSVLKKCAAAGLSLSEIANVVTRPLIGLDEEPSELEKICFAARLEVEAAMEEEEEESDEEDVTDDEASDDDDVFVESDDISIEGAGSGPFMLSSAPLDVSRTPIAAPAITTDDALFSMDEDGSNAAALRTPINSSPEDNGGVGSRIIMPSTSNVFTGATPEEEGGVGLDHSYYGATSSTRMGSESLTGSFDSDGTDTDGHHHPHDNNNTLRTPTMLSRGNRTDSISSASTFAGGFKAMPATYVAGAKMMRPQTAGSTAVKSQPRSKEGRRRRGPNGARVGGNGGGSRLRKMGSVAYPPLVEARGMATIGDCRVFSKLTDAQFQHLLTAINGRIDAALNKGIWEEKNVTGQPAVPQMSCPRF